MTRRRIVYPLFLAVLVLAVVVPQLPKAHAGSPSFFNHNGGVCANTPGTSCTVSLAIAANSELILILGEPAITSCGANGNPAPFITDTFFSSSFSLKACVHTNNAGGPNDVTVFIIASVGLSTSSGTDVVTLKKTNNLGASIDCDNGGPGGSGCGFDVIDYTAFTAFGPSNTFTSTAAPGSNNLPITTQIGSVVLSGSVFQSNGSCQATQTIGSQGSQNVLTKWNNTRVNNTNCTVGFTSSNINTNGGPYTDNIGWGSCGTCLPFDIGQVAIEVQGSATGASTGLVTQCFGNCGNPPITLANTNSTHSINFNTSLTVFYEFQSPINGVVNNVTTNLAKSYFNGQQVSLGLYTTLCNVGVTPFTASCPGQQLSLQTFTNPVKGRLSIFPSSLTVSVNTWVAIAISSAVSGLDINDTNLSVNVFQQNPAMPAILSAASQNGQSKMGLWAYISGTVGGTPPVIPPASCGADLLCTLTNATCTLTPTNCFIGAMLMAFAWSIATTIILLLAVGYLSKSFGITMTIPNGVILIIWFGWFMFFPAIVGAIWFTILMFIFFILAFSSFSTFMLKGSSGFGGQTA